MKLRFTIRDLLWLTLVVGLVVGWWMYQQRTKAQMIDDIIGKDQVMMDLRNQLADHQSLLSQDLPQISKERVQVVIQKIQAQIESRDRELRPRVVMQLEPYHGPPTR